MGQCTHPKVDRLQIVSVGSLRDRSTTTLFHRWRSSINSDLPLLKRERNWVELTFAKTSETTFPVTIPETMAGRISASGSFSFLTWRIGC